MKLQAPFIQLPLLFDAEALAREVQAIDESEWKPHPQGFAGNSMLPLVVAQPPTALAFFATVLQRLCIGRRRRHRTDGAGDAHRISHDRVGAERYALCLAGDCAAMTGEHDSLWLQLGQQGAPWLFQRDGDELRIFQAINRATVDEVPDLHPGRLAWLLERD